MNAFILILFFLTAKSQAACLPDISGGQINKGFGLQEIEWAALQFQDVYRAEIPQELSLVLHLETNNPRINAQAKKNDSELTIIVWGGMMSHPTMNPDTFILLLCHELGHFLGGPPLKSRNGWSSTEGQADYFSGKRCFHLFETDERKFIEAAVSLTDIYAEVMREAKPDLNTCDLTETERTNYGYPGVQCRLDTILAGWRGLPRPRCWFAP